MGCLGILGWQQAQTAWYNLCDSSQPLGLVEIKIPHSARHMTLSEACGSSTFCLQQQERDRRLKRRHNYYYQIQCQLYCIDIEWCDFVLTTKTYTLNRFTGTGHGWSNSYKSSKNVIGGSLGKSHSSRSCKQQGLASTPRNCIRVFALLLHNSTSYAITDNIMIFTYRGTDFLVMNIDNVQIPTYRHHLRSTPYLAITQPTVLISVCLHCTVYVSVSVMDH